MTDDTTTTPNDTERAAILEARIVELEASTRAQLIRAELKTEAVKAGIVDLDGLKLIDSAAVTLNAAGEVEGAAALVGALRRAKPWLFGGASSSSASAAPAAQAPLSRKATEMSYVEWQAARKELLKRR